MLFFKVIVNVNVMNDCVFLDLMFSFNFNIMVFRGGMLRFR